MLAAIAMERMRFGPSRHRAKPYVMLGFAIGSPGVIADEIRASPRRDRPLRIGTTC